MNDFQLFCKDFLGNLKDMGSMLDKDSSPKAEEFHNVADPMIEKLEEAGL